MAYASGDAREPRRERPRSRRHERSPRARVRGGNHVSARISATGIRASEFRSCANSARPPSSRELGEPPGSPHPSTRSLAKRGWPMSAGMLASINDDLEVVVLAQAVLYGTPLLVAALGELLAERSGVLNLGVEGMMLFGAAVGYWATLRVHGSDASVLVLAVGAAGLAGAAMAAIHAFLTITLRASQIVSGLALTIFAGGLGLSAYFGGDLHLGDLPATHQFSSINVFGLDHLWVIGPILFDQSALVYGSWAVTVLVALYFGRTRLGLNVRAVGEAPASADAMGINVTLYRYVHVLLGGALAGVGGACFSLLITPGWVAGDTLVNGAGWIAIALVIFAFWRAELCLVGAYLFGGLSALPFALQAHGVTVTPELLQSLPYAMTVVVLVLVSTAFAKRRLGAPAALGRPYAREER